MSANVQPTGFLSRLRAGARRLLETIIPCIKKTGDDVVDFTLSMPSESSSVTTEEPLPNRNESAYVKDTVTLPGAVHSPDLFDPTYFAVSSDEDTDNDTSDDTDPSLQPEDDPYADVEEISRYQMYFPLELTRIYSEYCDSYVEVARFFVFYLNGRVYLATNIYID